MCNVFPKFIILALFLCIITLGIMQANKLPFSFLCSPFIYAYHWCTIFINNLCCAKEFFSVNRVDPCKHMSVQHGSIIRLVIWELSNQFETLHISYECLVWFRQQTKEYIHCKTGRYFMFNNFLCNIILLVICFLI